MTEPGAMNGFDLAIFRFLTSFANRWHSFDVFEASILHLELFKGGFVMAVFWWAWFSGGKDEPRRRQVLVATLVAACVALFLASSLALLTPFRMRPMLAFQEPGTVNPAHWDKWSAFPSDHATLFLALATGFARAVPSLAWLLFAHAILFVCFPRVYIGLHYPTDVLAGAFLGVVCAYVLTGDKYRAKVAGIPLRFLQRSPGLFYAGLFVFTYLTATLFSDLRVTASALRQHWLH